MTHTRRILFATWDGGGNLPPTVAAITALTSRGHAVVALAEDASVRELAAAGARVLPWRHAPNRPDRRRENDLTREWEVPDHEQFVRVRDRLMVDPARAYAADVLDALQSFDADVVVSHDLLFGAIVGGEASRRPLAVFSPNLSLFPIPGIPPFGPGFLPAQNDGERTRDAHVSAGTRALLDTRLPEFNAVRVDLGLAPLDTMMDLAGAPDRILIASPRAFDFPLPSLPDRFCHVGPFLAEPQWASSAAASEPVYDVLVAFSTTYQAQESTIGETLEAIAALPVRAIATLGPALDTRDFVAPANVTIVEAADHDRILGRARAVVTHAGHGTVMRALAHGIPIVALPMGRDQNDNAARVEYHGAGVRLDRSASAAQIRTALHSVLANETFADNAHRLRREIEGTDAAAVFLAQIESLARSALSVAGSGNERREMQPLSL